MGSLIDTLKNLGLVRLALIASVALASLGGFYYVASKFSKPEMSLLYAELDLGDAGRIVSRLEGMGTVVEVRGNGSQVFVPSDQVPRLRMEMAEAGLPRGGSMGYEIFDKNDTFGTSTFVQDINHVRALEGELARTIISLSHVAGARVHLVLPKREIFSRESQEPSASIVLRLSGPGRLNAAKVEAIQHLVASAVPGLSTDRISVVDDNGNLLARGDSTPDSAAATNMDEMKLAYEGRLARTIETMVEKYVGPGKVRAEVTADMDFDRLTENTEHYDPDGQVIRSSQTVEEGNTENTGSGGAVGAAGNIPNSQQNNSNGSNQSKRTEETLNYEISKTIKTHVKESGSIRRLSVAVMVDGIHTVDKKGKENYTPRPKVEMDQLKKLIASAIGHNQDRKDTLEVLNMRFADVVPGTSADDGALFMGFTRGDLVRLAELLVVGFLGLLVMLTVFKPMVNRLVGAIGQGRDTNNGSYFPSQINNQDGIEKTNGMVGGPPDTVSLPKPDAGAVTQNNGPGAIPRSFSPLEDMINLKQVEGQVRASSLEKIGSIIDGNPTDAVGIVRNWMYEGQK